MRVDLVTPSRLVVTVLVHISLCRPFWPPPPHKKRKKKNVCVAILVCICVGVNREVLS